MTWETEDASDAQSQSQMTTDTYGYGNSDGNGNVNGNDQKIIWSDNPERDYFRSMIQSQDDHSLIGDSTINELLEERHGGSADPPGRTGNKLTTSRMLLDSSHYSGSGMNNNQGMVDSSGLSYYDTDAEDSTIGKIQTTAEDHGWFAMRRKKNKQNAKGRNDGPRALPPLGIQTEKSPGGPIYEMKSPISALSPHDKPGEGMGPNQSYAVPNPNIVPASPGNRPVAPTTPADGPRNMSDVEGYTRDGKIIPGYIFVTSGKPSAVETKPSAGANSKKKHSKVPVPSQPRRGIFGRQTTTGKDLDVAQGKVDKEGPKKFTKQELTVDIDDLAEKRRRRKFCLFKIGLLFLMVALVVGIAMLALVLVAKRTNSGPLAQSARDFDEDEADPPTMPPNFFLPAPGSPTGTPTTPPWLGATSSPTSKETGAVATRTPTDTVTSDPTMAPTGMPTVSPIVVVKDFLISQYPDSAVAFEDTTSPQYRALQWIAQDTTTALEGNRRMRGRRRDLQDTSTTAEMNWRLVQRWTLAVLYFATGGEETEMDEDTNTTASSWRSATGWLLLAEECRWAFVTCNESGQVQELIVQDNSLMGTIPQEIGLLSSGLVKLSFNANELEGALPSAIGLLTEISSLTIQGNQLTGSIPTEIGAMTSLELLSLSRNLLDGPIPSEIGNIGLLRTIDLALTRLTGTLPTEMGRLSDLEFLSLGGSEVSGTMPSQFGELQFLNTLKIARTNLVGSIPVCARDLVDEDIKADCQEVDCPCCTNCCVDGGGCSGTTPSPTPAPTRSPTVTPTPDPTAAATESPTKAPVTSEPTVSPTRSPTKDPTAKPIADTASPTVPPTPEPTGSRTPRPTEAATEAPLDAPTDTECQAEISTDRRCYVDGQDVVVSFRNCDAQMDDWIGVYVSGSNFEAMAEPVAWVWTSGDQSRQTAVSRGMVTFFEARGNGRFQITLARNQAGPPYSAYAVSNEFRLALDCS